MIYCLIITDLNLLYNNYFENFTIGYFTSYEKALETANRYLTEIEGFNKYPCKYDITEKPISDFNCRTSADEIFIVFGWNVNDNLDETDIVESDRFVSYDTALQELNNMKLKYHRNEWCIDKYKLDECEWADGFTRV